MKLLSLKTIFGVMMFRLISRTATRAGSSRWTAHAFTPTITRVTSATPTTTRTTTRPFHANTVELSSAVEKDLDSALDNILGDAFAEPNGIKKEVTKEDPPPSKVREVMCRFLMSKD